MKKKTSLWISGITTVAMLAVAVGSFAAWDTLTDSSEAFAAKSSTRVLLEVTSDTENNQNTYNNKTLLPTGAIKNDSTDVDELTAKFTPTLKAESGKTETKDAKIYAAIDTTGTTASLQDKLQYEIYACDASGNKTGNALVKGNYGDGSDVYDLTSGTTYLVSVKFDSTKVSATDDTDNSALVGTDIKTTVNCTAYKTTTN